MAVQEASIIVRGIIQKNYSDWGQTSEGGKSIFTFYEVQVSESLKGPALAGLIHIRSLGGEKDGVGMQVSGSATFSRGEDVVVMLRERNADGSYDIEGMMMGKFNIARDEGGKEFLTGPAIHESAKPGSRVTLESFRLLARSHPGPNQITQTQLKSSPGPAQTQSSRSPGPSGRPDSEPPKDRQNEAPQLQPNESESNGAWPSFFERYRLELFCGLVIALFSLLLVFFKRR